MVLRVAIIALLLTIVAVAASVSALLWTEPGRQQLVRIVESQLSTPEQSVSIATLEGALPQQIRLGGLRFSDAEGDWLTVSALEVDWRPRALLSGHIDVQRMDLRDPRLHRVPSGGAAEPAPDPLSGLRTARALRIEALRVEGGWLGPDVLGEAVGFRATSNITTEGDGIWQSRLRVERTDGVAAEGNIDARFDATLETLGINGTFTEPAGGVAARALSLPGLPPVGLTLTGDGPLSAWQGSIVAQAENLARIQSDIAIEKRPADKAYAFRATGQSRLATDLPEALAALQLAELDFDIDVLWDLADTLHIRAAHLTTPVIQAAVAGTVDLDATTLDASATVQSERLAFRAQDLEIDGATAQLTATGSWLGPEINVALTLGPSRLPEVSFANAELAVQLTPLAGSAEGYAATFDGRVIAADLPAPLPALVGNVLTFAGTSRLEPDLLQITALRLAGAQLQLDAVGSYSFPTGAIETSLVADLAALQSLSEVLPLKLSGAASAEGFFQRTGPDAPIVGTAAFTLTNPDFGIPSYDALYGDEIVATAAFSLQPEVGATFDAVDVSSGPAHLSASGSIAEGWSRVDGNFQFELPDVASLSSAVGNPVHGNLTSAGLLRGALTDPTIDVVLESTALSLGDVRLEAVRARLELAQLISGLNGNAQLTADSPFGPLAVGAGISQGDDRLSLRNLAASAGNITITGASDISLNTGIAAGSFTGQIPDIGPWSNLVGVTSAGAIDFDLIARDQDGQQVVELDLNARNVDAADIGASFEQGSVTGVATMIPGGPRFDARLQLSHASTGAQLALDEATVTLGGTPTAFDLALSASGPYADGLDLRAKARVTNQAGRLGAAIAQLGGTAGGVSFALLDPTAATFFNGRAILETTTLSVDAGQISLTADLDEQALDATITVADLPLSVLRPLSPAAPSGLLSGRARLTGSRLQPEAVVELEVVDVKSAAMSVETIPPGTGVAQATLRDGRLQANGSFTSVGAPLTFDASLPVRMPASGWRPSVPDDGRLSGSVNWQGDIALPWELLPLPDHRLSGVARLAIGISGDISAPRVEAALQLNDGEYENLQTGTLLTAVDLSIDSTDARTARIQLSATDGADGIMTGNGTISFETLGNPKIELTTSLQTLTVVRRDEVTAATSGTLALSGTPSAARLVGQIEVSPAEISLIASTLPPSVIDLPVIEVDGSLVVLPASGPPQTAGEIALDIQVGVPGRVFVRGRGLDSEWGGDLVVSGTANQPIVAGKLAALRGDFSFAGRSFNLRDSAISFAGTEKLDPDLDIVAENVESDLTAIIRVSGPASDPVIGLESIPPLPQDEIVSRVLFGKGVGSLSALEAAQLGAAVASLTGAGGSANVLDRFREQLGVDRLSVDASENGAAVSAGRYVGDRAFVGVRQGTAPGTSAATVELEVAPNITVESELNNAGAPKTGIFWKRDY